MKNLTAALLVTCLLLPAGRSLDAASSVDGLWDAVVVVERHRDSFPLRNRDAAAPQSQGFFFEGDRKVGSTSGQLSPTAC